MKMELRKLAFLPLFAGIREDDLSAMLICLGSFQRNYKKDEIIFLESNEVRSVGVILSASTVRNVSSTFPLPSPSKLKYA